MLNNRSSQKALDLVSKQEFLKAAAEFQTAFTEELLTLRRPYTSNQADLPFMIIRRASVKHRNAMLKFRPYLDNTTKDLFDRTWEDYEGETKYDGNTQDVATAKRKLALERIEKLLEYAK